MKIQYLRRLLETMSQLPEADLMSKEKEHEWISLVTELEQINIDDKMIEKEVNFPKYEKLRKIINTLNSKLKGYN